MSTNTDRPILELKNIVKKFGGFTAVDDLNLDIVEGELFTIVGPSGSGKTTMIRMLAGMDKPTGGDILLRGERINDVAANHRPTCMVFQSLALFPHRTVGENVEFSLKIRGVDKPTRRKRAEELLEQLHLPLSYYDKGVNQCSGGERQRVALARALAFDPEILFFDEPLSALDFRLRKTLEKELKDIHRITGKTFVYITHSLEEAMVMSDRIGIMREGRLVQVGSPDEIYNQPKDKFVAQFMGEVNVLEVEKAGEGRVRVTNNGIELAAHGMGSDFEAGFLVVRPEVVRIGDNAADMANKLTGKLFNEYSLGSRIQYQVRMAEGATWVVERLRDERYSGQLDDDVTIGWQPEDAMLVSE